MGTTQLKGKRPAFDPRTRPWYKEAIAAGKPIWSSIYAGFTPGTIFIAASQPLYDPKGKLVGVSGTDLSLLSIQTFLAETPVSPTGQTFLIERSGLLVASSSQERPFQTSSSHYPQCHHHPQCHHQSLVGQARHRAKPSQSTNCPGKF